MKRMIERLLSVAALNAAGLRTGFRVAVRPAWIGALVVWLTTSSALLAFDYEVFTNRTAWQQALSGEAVHTETFNEFNGWQYYPFPGVGYDQLPAGETTVGLLGIQVQRSSATSLIEGTSTTSVNGTNYLQLELSTQNGNMSPLSPALIPFAPASAFGADFSGISPYATLTIGTDTIDFGSYLGTSGFLGVVADFQFNVATFALTSPFNDLLAVDNVSFAVVPEPSTGVLVLIGIFAMLVRGRGLLAKTSQFRSARPDATHG